MIRPCGCIDGRARYAGQSGTSSTRRRKDRTETEDLVGPYELHDFFLYYMLRFGFAPKKLFRMAQKTFEGAYDVPTIYKWLRTFTWRFFAQHFKRTCLPDGPKVGSVAVSPRGDLRMPTDASSNLWIRELESLKSELGLE